MYLHIMALNLQSSFHDELLISDCFKSSITSYQLSTILSLKAIMKGINEDRLFITYIFESFFPP